MGCSTLTIPACLQTSSNTLISEAIAPVWLAAALCSAASAIDWASWGPAPILSGSHTGRVSAVACSPTDPNSYFATGADGGVWRTNDGGASWTPLTDHMPTSAMGALAIDPTNEMIVYAGTGENYSSPAGSTSDAIIAFDMDTGKKIWISQQTQGDAWNVGCLSDYTSNDANCP